MRLKLRIDAIIFDMDGLMFDTERIAQVTWQQAACSYGFDFPPETYSGIIGLAYPDVQQYTRSIFGTEFPVDAVYPLKQALMDKYITTHGLPVKPGLLELLQQIAAANLPVALASSSGKEVIQRNLQAAGVETGWFDAILSGDDISRNKPAPDIYLLAAQRLGVPAERCLVLEDSNAGIQAACAAGMLSIMVPDMLSPNQQSYRCAYRILPDLHAVSRLLFAEDAG
ncbi:MAG: HAD family hydrolase [Anaerolineales bacterium]